MYEIDFGQVITTHKQIAKARKTFTDSIDKRWDEYIQKWIAEKSPIKPGQVWKFDRTGNLQRVLIKKVVVYFLFGRPMIQAAGYWLKKNGVKMRWEGQFRFLEEGLYYHGFERLYAQLDEDQTHVNE